MLPLVPHQPSSLLLLPYCCSPTAVLLSTLVVLCCTHLFQEILLAAEKQDMRFGRMHLVMLPAHGLGDADLAPLFHGEDAQHARFGRVKVRFGEELEHWFGQDDVPVGLRRNSQAEAEKLEEFKREKKKVFVSMNTAALQDR